MKYSGLVDVYKQLESTTKRLDKTYYIAKLLENTSVDDLQMTMLLLEGRVFPRWDDSKIGVAAKLVLKSISVASGIDQSKIEDEWKKTGDLGVAAENLINKKKQATLFSSDLTVKKVFDNIRKLAVLEGSGSVELKTKLIAELLTSAKPDEARFIVRTVLEEMRFGVGEGVLREAIVWAFLPKVIGIFIRCSHCHEFVPITPRCLSCKKELDKKSVSRSDKALVVRSVEDIHGKDISKYDLIEAPDDKVAREIYNWLVVQMQEAIDLENDFGSVAKKVKEGGLKGLSSLSLKLCIPIKVMLFQKAKDVGDAFERVGKPAAFEYKYDGFRIQMHRDGENIKLFTRSLEDVTDQFPDVVKVVKEHIKSKNFILDSEVIGIDPKTKRWLPFQNISMRIKRKYDIDEMISKIPVMINIFDAMQIDGQNLLKVAFGKRRDLIEGVVTEVPEKLQMARQIVTDSQAQAERFYKESLSKGNEGVMAKNLSAPYKPGSRVGYGVKVKPVMETLDLVIVAATWGEGKRSSWLSSFTLACMDEDGNFVEIGKVGTGIKEKEEEGASFEQLTELLKPLVIFEQGKEVRVKPKIVVEINYEEIQKSPTYGSGYALRFPRVVKIREDKSVDDVSDISQVEDLFHSQRGKK